jgi:hypothetical protein
MKQHLFDTVNLQPQVNSASQQTVKKFTATSLDYIRQKSSETKAKFTITGWRK